MRVALLHDWLVGFRGGERVLESFCRLFPEADIYTLFFAPKSTSSTIERHKIYTSSLNALPGVRQHYRKLLPLFPWAVEGMRLEHDYDLVISSSHCVIKGMSIPEGTRHICYLHSPMRYIYDQYDSYVAGGSVFQKAGLRLFRNYLKKWDLKSNRQVSHFIANSNFVRQRVEDYYGVTADVVFPFVSLEDFEYLQGREIQDEGYYLIVSAFAPNKKIDLAVEAFNDSGRRLKIIGEGAQKKFLQARANKNIEFLGYVTRKNTIELMSRAKGFIFPGVDDFGITPLESLAAGTPVIAYRRGGVLDSLTEETGRFFDRPESISLNNAIDDFESQNFCLKTLQTRAQLFSETRFENSIKEIISRCSSK